MIFGIFTIIWIVLTAYFIPKRHSSLELFASSGFAVALGLAVDELLDLKYHLYGFLTIGKVDLFGEFSQLVIYSSANIIFLSLFPRRNKWKQALYIIACTAFSVIYELISVQMAFFRYNGWTWGYSALFYPVTFLFLIGTLKLIRNLIRKHNQRSTR